MKLLLLTCLLLYGSIPTAQSETLRVSRPEGKVAILPCGNETTGSVTWSRDTNGQREDILNITNGKTTKLISDPDRRYGSQADLALTIFRVSQSDAGRYYCGAATVELTVTDQTLRVTEGTQAVLHCGTQTTGTVTWSRDTNGQRVDILTTTNGEAKHAADNRYSSGPSLALIIYRVSRSDTGTYYCNRATVELTVIPGTDPDSRTTFTPASESTTTTTTSTPAPEATTPTITSRSASKNVTTPFTSTPALEATTKFITQTPPKASETSTAAEGGSKPTNDGQSEDQNNDSGLWKFLVIAAVSCLVVVVLLISWRFFYNRKAYAVNQNQEHFYETIDDPTLSTQPASNQKKTMEPVYSLATFPGDQTTDNQQNSSKNIYYLAEEPAPKEGAEQPYAQITKPTN